MVDKDNPQFTTHVRSIDENEGLQWGGDSEESETWSNAVDSSSNITVTDSGTITAGSAIPDSGVHRWKFEQDLLDSWGDVDGSGNGAISYSTDHGVGSYALSLDAADEYVAFGSNGMVGGLSSGTIVLWHQPSYSPTDGSKHRILHCDTGNGKEFTIYKFTDNNLYCGWNTDSDYRVSPSADNVLTQGNYVMLTVGWDSNGTTLYKNDATKVASNSTTPTTVTTNNSRIGLNVNTGQPANGLYDDTRVFTKKLTANEVSNLYTTGSING